MGVVVVAAEAILSSLPPLVLLIPSLHQRSQGWEGWEGKGLKGVGDRRSLSIPSSSLKRCSPPPPQPRPPPPPPPPPPPLRLDRPRLDRLRLGRLDHLRGRLHRRRHKRSTA